MSRLPPRVILLLFVPFILEAQIREPWNLSDVPRSYVAGWTKTPVVIDGRLDDSAWVKAPWTNPFVDIQGDSMPLPRFNTRVKMSWDDTFWYIGADIVEPDVWATLTKRDAVIFHDNDFEVFVDPNADNLEYMEMEMNAFNTVWDLLLTVPYRDGGHADNRFNYAGLKSAVLVHGTINNPRDRDTGWSVEIAIPWSAFAEHARRPLPPHDGDQWRVNFSRVEWQVNVVDAQYEKVPDKPEDNWVWSPQGVIDMHRPERWGYIQFSREADAKFRADPSWRARVLLHHVYYAERLFEKRYGHWAASLDELGIPPNPSFPIQPVIEVNAQGYTATVNVLLGNGSIQHWHIRQDSRIWSD